MSAFPIVLFCFCLQFASLIINGDDIISITDDDKCESCAGILEELETIDDDTDDHGIQFVKSNDVKLAHEIGIFSFPALVYYETGVPIMYDGEFSTAQLLFLFWLSLFIRSLCLFSIPLGNLMNEKRVLQWLIDQKSKNVPYYVFFYVLIH